MLKDDKITKEQMFGKETGGELAAIYTNLEGSSPAYSNEIEIGVNEGGGPVVYFYNRRPIRRNPMTVVENDESIRVASRNPDTLEFALQSSVLLSMGAAVSLYQLLGKYLEDLNDDAGDEGDIDGSGE